MKAPSGQWSVVSGQWSAVSGRIGELIRQGQSWLALLVLIGVAAEAHAQTTITRYITLPSTTLTGVAINDDGTVLVSTNTPTYGTQVRSSDLSLTQDWTPGSPSNQGFTDTARGTASDLSLQIDTNVLRQLNLATTFYDSIRNVSASYSRVGDAVVINSITYVPLMNQADRTVSLYNYTDHTTDNLGFALPVGTTDLTLFKRGESLANALLLFSTGDDTISVSYANGTSAASFYIDGLDSYITTGGLQRISINDSGMLAFGGMTGAATIVGLSDFSTQLDSIAAIPEPTVVALGLGASALAIAMLHRRRSRRAGQG